MLGICCCRIDSPLTGDGCPVVAKEEGAELVSLVLQTAHLRPLLFQLNLQISFLLLKLLGFPNAPSGAIPCRHQWLSRSIGYTAGAGCEWSYLLDRGLLLQV